MSTLLLGAIIALTTVGIVLWLADKQSLVTTRFADPAEESNRPRLSTLLQAHWHAIFAAVAIALAVTAFAGELLTRSAGKQETLAAADEGDIASAYEKLKAFAATDAAAPSEAPAAPVMSGQPPTTGLADVETMIAKLEARLEKEPNDAAGWRMLGWSYQNTGRPDKARDAYDRGLAVDPSNAELKTARAALGGMANATASGPTSEQVAAADAMPEQDRQAMIQGMVEGLASKLSQSPHDEDGWTKLIRSRVVLGDPAKAAEALKAAQRTFAGEPAALERLAALGRELGLETR